MNVSRKIDEYSKPSTELKEETTLSEKKRFPKMKKML